MRSLILLAVALFALAGCNEERRKKEAAAFVQACGNAGFTPQQCVFLLAVRQDLKNDSADDAALAMAGLGIATSSAARR